MFIFTFPISIQSKGVATDRPHFWVKVIDECLGAFAGCKREGREGGTGGSKCPATILTAPTQTLSPPFFPINDQRMIIKSYRGIF
jgi:hypothetical protein